jgi:hypothetical protein
VSEALLINVLLAKKVKKAATSARRGRAATGRAP